MDNESKKTPLKGTVILSLNDKEIYQFSSRSLDLPVLSIEEIEINRYSEVTKSVITAYVAGRHEWKPMKWNLSQRAHLKLSQLTTGLIETHNRYTAEMLITDPVTQTWKLGNIFFIDDSEKYTGEMTVYYDFAINVI